MDDDRDMDQNPRRDVVAAAVESIHASSHEETRSLMVAMAGAGWPGRVEDRLDRGALEWLRRWAPARTVPGLVERCACAAGRCAVCN
jgi:hypothetical protein